MTARFGSYDLALANPPEYSGWVCPGCNEPQEFPIYCDRCESNLAAMDESKDVAALVKAARELLENTRTWNSELGRIVERFPEMDERSAA